MGVSSLEPGREKDLRHHLVAAVSAHPNHPEISALAKQLEPLAVVPLLGAGASYDCGMRLAWEVAKDLNVQYEGNHGSPPIPDDHPKWHEDLGRVADAIGLAHEPRAAVDEVGFDEAELWPAQGELTPHFCGYRILARMAREDMLEEAITFNYDCGFEEGLQQEGFQLGRTSAVGGRWLDHATVVADHATHCRPRRRGAFVLSKAHGCAARYRETETPGGDAWKSIIVRWSQLLDWRTDFWARDVFADRARRNVLLLIGFSGQDPVIHAALNQILRELNEFDVFESPRIVVLDTQPKNLALQMLIKEGKGGFEHERAITHIEVDKAKEGLTEILTLLFAEMLAKRIEPTLVRVGVELPSNSEERLVSLIVSTPAAMRWAFMIRRSDPQRDAGQRINLEQAASNGYVPQTADPYTAAYSMLMREKLRTKLNLPSGETIDEAIAGKGFVLAPQLGKAYLPTGLRPRELGEVAPSAVSKAGRQLDVPKGLDCIAVGEDEFGKPVGISLGTGSKVRVP
jgi:SIR2-like domain